MASVQTRKPPIIGNKANNPAPAVRASPAAAPVIRASPASPGATPPGGATPPRGATPTRSAAPASSDDIEQKKRLIAQRLQEKEKRLSRLSMALGSGDPRASQKQQEVEQLAEKLRKMQGMLERSEKVRKHEEAEEQRRINEERAMHRLTQDLEKSAPAGAMSKSQKNRRTQNMMSLMRESNGSISEDKLQALEAKESAQDERERQERKVKMEATERRLKEVNDKIRDQAKAREEQNMLKLQKQLEFMENRLKDLEGGSSGGKVKEEEDDDDQSMRDWEEKMRALRQERERALAQRKQDMNKRLRELQEMVEQKKREREDLQSSAQEKKYQDMVAMLKNFDNDSYKPPAAAGGGGGGSVGGFSQADLEKWMQQKVEERLGALEAKMKADHARAMAEKEAQMMQYTGSGGGGVDMSLILDKLKQFDELSKKVGQIDDKIKKGGFSAAPGVELTMTYDEIVKEIQNLQGIIFDPNSDEKTIADANINLEKVMQQLEQTDEYRKEKEEKRAAAEKLNKEALERVKTAMRAMTPEQLKKRLTDNPELKLVLMEPAQIGKLHQNDFKGFAMRGLSLDEVRAVRGCCPTFRKDQKIQMEWQESIEAKIEDMATKAASGPPPPKPQTKKAKPGKEWKKPSAAKGGAASSGDMFAQIRARAKAMGGGDDAPEPEEPEKPAVPNVAIVASGPPPPPPPGAKKAPPPPMGKPPPPPVFNSEPPPTQAPKGTPASVVEQRKTLQDLNALNAKSNANGQLVSPEDIKNSVDQLHSMVFSGGPEADIVNRLKVLSEQIKSVAGDHKELAPKARFLIMAVKEAMVSRNGTPNEVSHSKQKLSVVVNSLKRALDG